MMTLILFILCIIGLTAIKQWKKYQSKLIYWERINELEEQRKNQILRRALINQQLK